MGKLSVLHFLMKPPDLRDDRAKITIVADNDGGIVLVVKSH